MAAAHTGVSPPDEDRRPGQEAEAARTSAGTDDNLSLGDDVAAPLAPLVALVRELRPDLPQSIAESLIREALDAAADAVLDVEWARTRARMYPEAIAVAHGRHMPPYAERRTRQLTAARLYRPGDLHGAVTCRCSRCLPLEREAVA